MMELPATRAGHIGRALSATAILLFLAMPIVIILVTSFGADGIGTFPPKEYSTHWYEQMAAPGGNWATSIALSSLIASLTTVFSLILGATAATALARGRLPLHTAVYGLVLAPLLIPQVVIALGLFLFFEPAGMLGSPLAIALGHTVLAAPIAVLIMISTLRGIDERLEDAAASMGAGRLTIARRITFPGHTRVDRRRGVLVHHQLRRVLHRPVHVDPRHPHPAGPRLQRPAVRRRPDRHRGQRRPHRPGHPGPRPGRSRPQTRRPPRRPERPPVEPLT